MPDTMPLSTHQAASSALITAADLQRYQNDGYLTLPGFLDRTLVSALHADAERLLVTERDRIHPRNLRCRYMPHHQTGERLFEVFDPVIDLSPACAAVCAAPALLEVLGTLYGEPAVLFKDKLIFKPPGATGYQLHQDIPLGWVGFPRTFLSVMIPIDSCSAENGCLRVYRGYHHDFLAATPTDYMLPDDAVDESRGIDLMLEPGDVVIFHGLTPHRSAPNLSPGTRRVLYASYNARSDGGDQRAAHYAEFQDMLRQRLANDSSEPLFFK